jgi:hypothetical protein
MQEPIQVISSSDGDNLDPLSRLDYSRIYTVEHNVKVYDFGTVSERDRSRLVQGFHAALREPDFEDPQTAHQYTDHYSGLVGVTPSAQNPQNSYQYSSHHGGTVGETSIPDPQNTYLHYGATYPAQNPRNALQYRVKNAADYDEDDEYEAF